MLKTICERLLNFSKRSIILESDYFEIVYLLSALKYNISCSDLDNELQLFKTDLEKILNLIYTSSSKDALEDVRKFLKYNNIKILRLEMEG